MHNYIKPHLSARNIIIIVFSSVESPVDVEARLGSLVEELLEDGKVGPRQADQLKTKWLIVFKMSALGLNCQLIS